MSPRQMMTSLLALLLAVGTHSQDTPAQGCEYDGMLYAAGQAITVGGCESWRCINGNWQISGKLNPNQPAPCPPGAFPYRQSCLTEEPLWLTRGEAAGICQIKGGRLLELYGEDEPHTEAARRQLAAALNPGGGYWVTAGEPASDGLCAAVPPGAIDKEVVQLRCDMRLRPVCVIPRGPCDQGVCTVNEHTYDNNTVIETIDQCTSIVCLNSYPMTVIDETCCKVTSIDGDTDLVPSGDTKIIDECTSVYCDNSDVVKVVDETCCAFEDSDGVTNLYTSGSDIKTCIDQCTTIVCRDSKPTNVTDETCDPTVRCCPEGFTLCADYCWHSREVLHTYDAAKQYCANLDAIVPVPRSEEENTCARDVAWASEQDENYYSLGPINGTGVNEEGDIEYGNWDPDYNQPELRSNPDTCVMLNSANGYWYDWISCYGEAYVLCQM